MSMTKIQALDLINRVYQVYNLEFDDDKIDVWCEMLEEYGDYNESLKKLKSRILSDNNYPPNLSEVLERPYTNENAQQFNQLDEEVKRERQDPNYQRNLQERLDEIKRKAENGELSIYDL